MFVTNLGHMAFLKNEEVLFQRRTLRWNLGLYVYLISHRMLWHFIWAYMLAQTIGRCLATVTGEVTPRSLSRLSSVSRKETCSPPPQNKVWESPGSGVCGRLICATYSSNSLIYEYNTAFKVSLVFRDQLCLHYQMNYTAGLIRQSRCNWISLYVCVRWLIPMAAQ
jgi:hypothetical protein